MTISNILNKIRHFRNEAVYEAKHVEGDFLRQGIQELLDQQGWNDNTLLTLCHDFILQNGLTLEFLEYLTSVQKQENGDDSSTDGVNPEIR